MYLYLIWAIYFTIIYGKNVDIYLFGDANHFLLSLPITLKNVISNNNISINMLNFNFYNEYYNFHFFEAQKYNLEYPIDKKKIENHIVNILLENNITLNTIEIHFIAEKTKHNLNVYIDVLKKMYLNEKNDTECIFLETDLLIVDPISFDNYENLQNTSNENIYLLNHDTNTFNKPLFMFGKTKNMKSFFNKALELFLNDTKTAHQQTERQFWQNYITNTTLNLIFSKKFYELTSSYANSNKINIKKQKLLERQLNSKEMQKTVYGNFSLHTKFIVLPVFFDYTIKLEESTEIIVEKQRINNLNEEKRKKRKIFWTTTWYQIKGNDSLTINRNKEIVNMLNIYIGNKEVDYFIFIIEKCDEKVFYENIMMNERIIVIIQELRSKICEIFNLAEKTIEKITVNSINDIRIFSNSDVYCSEETLKYLKYEDTYLLNENTGYALSRWDVASPILNNTNDCRNKNKLQQYANGYSQDVWIFNGPIKQKALDCNFCGNYYFGMTLCSNLAPLVL